MDTFQHLIAWALTAAVFIGVFKKVNRGPEELWDIVDISTNLEATHRAVKRTRDGVPSIIQLVIAVAKIIGFGALAWHFDLASSWGAMAGVREEVSKSLTDGIATYSVFIFAVLTYLPTIMEMFGAATAREQSRISQIAVIGLSIFDLFTDLPHTQEFMSQYYHYFVNDTHTALLNIFYEAGYYICFAIWWAMASYGWELLLVMAGYEAICYAAKGFGAEEGSSRRARYAED